MSSSYQRNYRKYVSLPWRAISEQQEEVLGQQGQWEDTCNKTSYISPWEQPASSEVKGEPGTLAVDYPTRYGRKGLTGNYWSVAQYNPVATAMG